LAGRIPTMTSTTRPTRGRAGEDKLDLVDTPGRATEAAGRCKNCYLYAEGFHDGDLSVLAIASLTAHGVEADHVKVWQTSASYAVGTD